MLILVVCEVQNVKDVQIFVLFHSAAVETCMELVVRFAVVCQFVCSVPFVLLSQETQAFQPQSCRGGTKVPHPICQGGLGSIC